MKARSKADLADPSTYLTQKNPQRSSFFHWGLVDLLHQIHFIHADVGHLRPGVGRLGRPRYPGGGGGGGGRNSLRPYRQQRPMRTNLASCLGLIHNGKNHSTNRFLILVPHEGTHGTMCLINQLKQLRMVRPKITKITKMRAIKKAMPLIPNSPGGAEGASAQMPRHSRPAKPTHSTSSTGKA